MKTILIIEDEKDMVTGLKFNLEARDYDIIVAYDGETGYHKALDENPDLVLLDIMLPKLNGFELCKKLKKEAPGIPVIMLTAKSQEAEIVTGLELGADDYITKPFSVLELLARINAVLRRTESEKQKAEFYRFGNFEIDFKKSEARKNGSEVKLTPREFEILRFFIENRGNVVSRDDLLSHIWGYETFPYTRTIDAHIAKLRHKIEEKPEDPKLLVTVHGLGYKLMQ